MKSEIKRFMRLRDHYLAKARPTNNGEDWFLYRIWATNLIRVYKRRYSKKLIKESNNPTAFWKTMKKEKSLLSTNIKVNGSLSTDGKETAYGLNLNQLES